MLDTLRASATGIFAKIMLGILVLMFGVWGIGDVIRNPSGKLTIATVGNENITSNDYLRALRREEENIRQIMGDNYSPEVLKDPMLVHHILQQLINRALLKQESEALGLVPSDADVVRRIRANPAFQDDKGNFDKEHFDMMLQHSHSSEKVFVEGLRQDMAINMLIDTLTAVTPVTDIAARTLFATREEGRNISLYSLKPTAITNIPAPDAAQTKAYYDAHAREFTVPEYRTVSYVTISSSNVGKGIKISEDDLKAAYKERLDEFKHPERRTVEQLIYSSQDAANKASAMLKDGKSFEQVGKNTDIQNKNSLLIGKIERGNLIESAADKVFTLKTGQVTEPIQTPFGWNIFHVTAIEPPSTSSFEEVRPVLEKDLIARGADDALSKLANQFQDALAGGNTLAEAAKDMGLKVIQAGPFDQLGKTPANAKSELPDLDKFIEVAFKTDENAESSMTAAKGGVFYILHVDKVTSEHRRPLDEVKESVVTGWQNEERQKRLGELAREIGKKFATASERSATIEKYHLDLVKTGMIKHSTRSLGDMALPSMLVTEVFTHKPQEGTNAYLTKNGSYLLATVDGVVPAPSSESDPKMADTLKNIRKGLETVGQNELLEQYAHYLEQKYSVSINEAALQAVQK